MRLLDGRKIDRGTVFFLRKNRRGTQTEWKKIDQLQMKGFSFFVHSFFTVLECNCTFSGLRTDRDPQDRRGKSPATGFHLHRDCFSCG